MKRVVVLVTLLVLALIFAAFGCTKESVITIPTQIATPTSTPLAQPSNIPEMPGITLGQSYSQPENGYTVITYHGRYVCAVNDSDTSCLEGRVFLQGDPMTKWIEDRWPSDYARLVPGFILIGFNLDTGRDKWLYARPGEAWRLDIGRSDMYDVYYYAPGYMWVKFENVRIGEGQCAKLPDVILVPRFYDVLLYPED